MKVSWKWMPVLASIISLLVLSMASTVRALGDSSYSVGDKVNNVSLKSLAGGSVKLSDFKSKVIVLNFFASW